MMEQQKLVDLQKKKMDSKIFEKGLFTGIVEKDEKGNFFCGEYLLDFKMVTGNFSVGDLVKSIIEHQDSQIKFLETYIHGHGA